MEASSIVARLISQVENRPLPSAPVAITLPDEDDQLVEIASEKLGYAEGQSFAIEYMDSRGRKSTRRITVWGVAAGSAGVPSLIAFCHERNAQRQFRVDRIHCFIDYDGEVFSDVPMFLTENFGMDLNLASSRGDDATDRWSGILKAVRHEAVLLSALSRSDGKTVAEEVELATDYLSRLAEMNGLMLSEGEILSIYRYANRLRPTEKALSNALQHLSNLADRHLQRLLLTAVALIDADGARHPAEISLVNEIAIDLIGTTII